MFGSRTQTRSQYESTYEQSYRWRSSESVFTTYNSETGENEALPENAKLIPIALTYSVNGLTEQDHGRSTQRWNRIYSNEFQDFKEEHIRVYEKDNLDDTKTLLVEGVYNPTVKQFISGNHDIKFTTNVYCLLDDHIVRLELSGASLTAWINFTSSCKKSNISLYDRKYFYVSSVEEKKNGVVKFNAPVFAYGDIDDEENEKASAISQDLERKIAYNRSLRNQDSTADITNAVVAQKVQEEAEEAKEENIDLSELPF